MSCFPSLPPVVTSPSFTFSSLPAKPDDSRRETLTLTDFTTLVSAALAFDTPIFEPLTLPSRSDSPPSFQNNIPSRKSQEKLSMLKKIKSILLRESEPSPTRVSDLPKLPLPPPTDPLFTPHMPLPIALERGLLSCNTQVVDPSNITVTEDCESCQLSSCSEVFSPCMDPQSSSTSTTSEASFPSTYSDSLSHAPSPCMDPQSSTSTTSEASFPSTCSDSLSHPPSSVDLTSDPADPFAKGRVQVLRRSTGSSTSNNSYGSVSVRPYILDGHPYATPQSNHSPSKKSRNKFITEAPLPPPSGPLPPPPTAYLDSSPPASLLHSELPPLLPMPTRPLPPTPDVASSRSLIRDWTLDLPFEATAFDSFRANTTAVGATASSRRWKACAKTRRARRTSLQKAALTHFTTKRDHSLGGDWRPGHRRKGSPFPLLFESPPPSVISPLSTPTAHTFPQTVSASPPPLAHTLVLSSTVPPSFSGPDVPVTPTSSTSECESATSQLTTPPLGGRANIPGWFFDDSDISEQGHEKSQKGDGEERYWTAPESTSTHAH